MICAWQELLNLLPFWMRKDVHEHGASTLQELRIRCGLPPELIHSGKSISLTRYIQREDIQFIINAASQYSPWSAATSTQGYLTAPGGHRIGICGEVVLNHGIVSAIRTVHSLCIRVARDFPGMSEGIPTSGRSILIIGKPGSGKTTLLRDLIRRSSNASAGSISVVDERGELFPVSQDKICFNYGKRTDILSFCPKKTGILNVLRTMGPSCIAVDEITQDEDCQALLQAGWSGVHLLATAHAESRNDLYSRPVYRPIVETGLFDLLITMQPDKSWKAVNL